MNLKYKNELIILASIIFLLSSYIFKYKSFEYSQKLLHQKQNELIQLQEVISLEDIWTSNKVSKKINSLKTIVPAKHIVWRQQGTKLTAKFIDINSMQLNNILNKILNIAIQIESITIKKDKDKYTMELKCKW